ncbi:major facilitator superfamily domain-containing protein [Coemansia mojavensis]|nr:major facilitator superfamily domain-containing protein [Coemansia mojavensis]
MHSVSSEPKRFRRRSLRTYPRGMGIMVVFCSFLALSLGPGLLNAYGVYEEEYNRLYDNKDEQEWQGPLGSPVIFIGIIQIFLANGMGFIGGKCAQRFGPGPAVFVGGLLMAAGLFAASYSQKVWQLCLSQGVVFGLGVCLTWIPAASAPSSWFSKDRGVATGVTHMGLGIGGLVFAPITRFLLEKAGTAGSLRWLALIMLVGVSIVSIGIHNSMGVPAKPASRAATHKPTIFKSLRFWLLSLGIGMGQASWYTILLFMTSISVSVGLDVHNAAIVLGAINGASAVGQFAAGYAADLIGPINALVLFTFVATLSNLILFLPGLSFHVLLAYACVCGASIGAADPLTVIAGVMQFGRERAAMTTGLVYGSVGMLVTVMAPCAQVMQHELNRGFRPIYIFVLALFATSTLLLVLLRLRISRKLAFRA